MFCPNCGKELKDTSKFCTGCGAAIKKPPVVAQEPLPVESPTHVEPEPIADTPQSSVAEPVKPVVESDKPDNKPETPENIRSKITNVDILDADEENFEEPELEPEENTAVEQEHIENTEDDEDSWFEEENKASKKAFVDISSNYEPKKKTASKQSKEKKASTQSETQNTKGKKGIVIIIIAIVAILAVAGAIIAVVLQGDAVPIGGSVNENVDEYNDNGYSLDDLQANITTGYWVIDTNYKISDEYEGGVDALRFAPIDNNETFDGIMLMTNEFDFPYIIGEDGTITVFNYWSASTDSYDWRYYPEFEVTIEESENGSEYLIVKQMQGGGDVKRYNKEDSSNDMLISLLFSEWSDYFWKPESVWEYNNEYCFAVGDLQRSVKFFDFHREVEDDGCNADVSLYRYDEEWGWEVSWHETFYYSIDIDEKCIYIDDARYDFNDDFTQLYNTEEDLTLYRVTDFHLGEIADTDFPPGEFGERDY
ncbi:MAG: zinc-ribbon domain-containing protein [Clostridia bacterium]|nr:zinc-ribbon domain-containing protein [Clostridia bacterium]